MHSGHKYYQEVHSKLTYKITILSCFGAILGCFWQFLIILSGFWGAFVHFLSYYPCDHCAGEFWADFHAQNSNFGLFLGTFWALLGHFLGTFWALFDKQVNSCILTFVTTVTTVECATFCWQDSSRVKREKISSLENLYLRIREKVCVAINPMQFQREKF